MNLNKCILTNNDCYKANRTITPKGVMVHSTGANNPNLKRYVQPDDGLLGANNNSNDWNRSGTNACVHAFIGKLSDGSIATYQTLPWNWRGWHCGTGTSGTSANNTHISFEICEDGLSDTTYFNAVYLEAVELTAYLCKQYSLDPLSDGVVICHSEGYRRGIASNHSDVMHWFPKHGKSMDTFRADVAAEMEDEMTQDKFNEMMETYLTQRGSLAVSDWAQAGVATAKEQGISDGTRPQALVTRQETMQMIVNAIN